MELRLDGDDGWAYREDRGELLSCVEREDGTLLVEGYAARAGVLEYRTPTGIVRELVRADTLAKVAHGMARTPVTLEHPDPQLHPHGVTPENAKQLVVGDTDGEVIVHDGGFVRVKMAIRDRDAITAVKRGKRELSHGYRVKLDHTPGVDPEFGRYDCEQVARIGNHIAITDRARAGREVHLRADSGFATSVISGVQPTITPGQARGDRVDPKYLQLLAALGVTRADGVTSEPAALDVAIAAAQKRNDTENTELTTAKSQLAAEKTRADTEKARADAATAELATLKAAETARADAEQRGKLEATATALGIDPKLHTDSKALRRAIASKHLGSEIKADASDDYVTALVDLAGKGVEQRGDGRKAGAEAWKGSQPAQPLQRGDSAPRPKSLFQHALARSDSARNAGGGES